LWIIASLACEFSVGWGMADHEFRIRTSMPLLLFALFAAAAPQINAQDYVPDDPDADVDEYFEEIVVTGTRIKRRDFVTPSPLVSIGSEALDSSGQATIEEALNRMPQVSPVSARATNWGDGTARVDLRGLGPGRSLVMLNGRRVAPTGVDNAVDLNNIPQFLIERVEIITGGTSTVYGSDALAGVINFITKQNYVGFGIEAGVSMAGEGDAESYELNLAYGYDLVDGRGNVAVYANFIERKSLLAGEREHTRIQYWDDWEGNLIATGSWSTPAGVVRWPEADLGNGPVNVTFDPDGIPREFDDIQDPYNYQPTNYLQVPLDRVAVGLMGHYDLSDQYEAYLEASYVRNEPAMQNAPTPAWTDIEVNLDNPVLTPEAQQLFADQYSCAPNLACLNFSNRFPALGPRLVDHEQDYARIVAGFRGELGQGWDIDGWISYTDGSSLLRVHNDASQSRYLQGLLVNPSNNECFDPTGGCVPLNVFGEGNLSTAGAEFIRLSPHENVTEQTQKLASVFVTGSPIDTWAGPLDVAVGAEWRSDETYFKADDVLFSGDALGWAPSSPVYGTEEVYELYAEAVVPLASNRAWADYLGLEVGSRYSDYKHAGGVWTYKAGSEWQPIEGLRFRAMFQRSTRAPNSSELFEEQRTDTQWFVWWDTFEDPCSASADPVGNGLVEKCVIQGLPEDQIGIFEATLRYPVDFLSGGNPDLIPEVGETWTVGAVISPERLTNWAFSIDYFSLEVTDTIGFVDSFDICFDPVNVDHVFCENIARDVSGNMSHFTELTSNRGLLETTGLDTQIQYRTELPDFLSIGEYVADIGIDVYWTHLLAYKEQENLATEIFECAGYFGWPCDFIANTSPEDRVTTNIHYASGPFGAHVSWRWIDGTRNAAPMLSYIYGVPDPDLAIPVVDDQHYVDLGIDYEFGDTFMASFGVNNLLDSDPPQMADQATANNTDTGFYDVFGRSYYLYLSAQF
jgi:outer membrane receptor protein involved in Fe transport